MADIQNEIAGASQDLKTIEDFVNLPADSEVYPRLLPSVNVGTLAGTRQAIFEAGGLPATPFKSFTAMNLSPLDNDSYAIVTDSTDEANGLYIKTDGEWVKSKYDPTGLVLDSGNGVFIGRPADITVDSSARTITFNGRFSRNKKTYSASNAVVSYTDSELSTAKALVFNVASRSVSIVHGSTYANMTGDSFIFGTISNFNGKPLLTGVGGYYLDGAYFNNPTYGDISLVLSDASAINFDFDNNQIVLDRTIWIPYQHRRLYVYPQTIDLPSSRDRSARFLLVYNMLNNTVEQIEAAADYKLNPHQVIICAYKEDTKTIYGLDVYMVDGVSSEESKKRNGALHLPLFEDGALNFDFANHEITLSTEMWIPMPAGRVKVEPQTVQLDPTRNKNIAFRDVLLVNLDDMSLVVKQAITNFKMPPNHILIGAYHERDGKLWNLDRAKINGMSPKSDAGASISHVAYGYDTKKVPNLNVPDSFTDSDDVKLTSMNSGRVNGWYDQLMSEHPEYITREILGTDASGTLPIYCYTFKPPRYKKQGGSYAERPKIMIQALHNERINHIYPYLLMREICNNWQSNEHLEGLRWGVEFKVIPVLNPWGLDNGSRTNSNGVDINRNYPHGWKLQTELPQVNSGPEPLSESEAQASYNLMTTYKPHIIVDCHSFGAFKDYGRSAWLTSLSDADNEIISNTILPFYSNYAKRYEWLEPFNNLFEVHDLRSKQGTAADARVSLGILGGTFETAWNLRGSADAEIPGHNIAINFNVDLFLYFIIKNLEYLNVKGMI